ncbi:MAG TPA: SDR family NAD(P)-dependent oxidoreductase, partial [Caldilineaceae bacterium]|nr:SDR family NAD(P)-dependent oxidoreductase [Caldilineaceae bacterium]
MSLTGKVAIITGASRGIGLETARVLANQGMKVALAARSPQVETLAAELCDGGATAIGVPTDVTSRAQVEALVDRVEGELGPLWLLVNNAGLLRTGPTAEMPEEDWDAVFAVDAKGVFLCSQAAIRRMIPRRAGRIVNVSSIAGHIVRVAQIAYCSAKAAVIHFSRCLAVEMAPYGITVNCLCPGMTWTEMLGKSAAARGLDLDAMVALIPAGHMADPKDHAHLVAYFASEEAG